MKVVIAGSRDISDKSKILPILANDDFAQKMTEMIHGGAKGVDQTAEELVRELWENTMIKRFEADWEKYGDSAGPMRNQEMAEHGDSLIAIWDGESKGTRNMINEALERNLDIHVYNLGEEQ